MKYLDVLLLLHILHALGLFCYCCFVVFFYLALFVKKLSVSVCFVSNQFSNFLSLGNQFKEICFSILVCTGLSSGNSLFGIFQNDPTYLSSRVSKKN